MYLADKMESTQRDVLREASAALHRSHLTHYIDAGSEVSDQRLEDLYVMVRACVAARNLVAITEFARNIAHQRFDAGYDSSEVQTAFNVLEEAIWHEVISSIPAEELVEAAGLVSTVLGAGKDELARTWVSLAASRRVPSLDLGALFQGAASI